MRRSFIGFAILAVVSIGAAASAPREQQTCLHGAGETPDQAARRKEALAATRNINNIQANQPGARDRIYIGRDQLASSPFVTANANNPSVANLNFAIGPDEELLPGWKLTFDLTRGGYWFMVKDTTDPCGFTWISNQDGLIYKAEHLR